MKKKVNFKFILIFSVIILAIILVGTTKVEATEFSNNNKDYILNVDLGVEGNGTSESEAEYYNGENDNYIDFYVNIYGVNQQALNEYASSEKEIPATIKIKVPNETTKVEVCYYYWNNNGGNKAEACDPQELILETIDGQKYAIYNLNLQYENIDDCVWGQPVNKDIEGVRFHNYCIETSSFGKIRTFTAEDKYDEYHISVNVSLLSENKLSHLDYNYVDKYGNCYIDGSGGLGSDSDKWYLSSPYLEEAESYQGIPSDKNLEDVYFELVTDVYQGENIKIENMGTLYYAGIIGKDRWENRGPFYVYKNRLSELKSSTENPEPKSVQIKSKSGYVSTQYIYWNYRLSDYAQDIKITDNLNTENKDLKINMLFKGTGDAKFGAIEIKSTDALYKKLEEGFKNLTKEETYNKLEMETFDIHVIEGNYRGNLNITFNVGTKYNGKEYIIGHLKNGLDYESFRGTVEDGKITITVDGLSPFMLSVVEKTTGKKDEANGTGTSVSQEKDKVEADTTTAKGPIQYVGIKIELLITIVILVVGATIAYTKYRKYRNI